MEDRYNVMMQHANRNALVRERSPDHIIDFAVSISCVAPINPCP